MIVQKIIQKSCFLILRINRVEILTFLDNNISLEARNIAIRQAKGKYIAFLDSDDYWEKEKLENQIAFMKSNDIAF